MKKLHWNVNANEWHYYLRGKAQVVMFGSGGRSKIAELPESSLKDTGIALRTRLLACGSDIEWLDGKLDCKMGE